MDKEQLNLFLYWISERHSIFLKKEAGKGRPWTADPILDEYKFTNPFRENDRVTRELRNRIKKGDNRVTVFTKTIIFRMFNWPQTYDVLFKEGLVSNWDTKKAIKVLREYKAKGNKVFTGAYIITNNGRTTDKIQLVCEAVGKMLEDADEIVNMLSLKGTTLESAVILLSSYDMVGQFIGYELVTDLRHSILKNAPDIYTWANPGPGAKRGMHRILFSTERGQLPKGEKVDYQETMRRLLFLAQRQLTKKKVFKDTVFEMRDIEHSLCEFDKYMRVKNGEGRPRSKYK